MFVACHASSEKLFSVLIFLPKMPLILLNESMKCNAMLCKIITSMENMMLFEE
jgi:hypothetical protein